MFKKYQVNEWAFPVPPEDEYKLTPEEHEVWMEKMRGYIWMSTVKKHGEPAKEFWGKWVNIAKECAKARETGDLPRFY